MIKARIGMLESYRGSIGYVPGLSCSEQSMMEATPETADKDQKKEVRDKMKDKFQAALLLVAGIPKFPSPNRGQRTDDSCQNPQSF